MSTVWLDTRKKDGNKKMYLQLEKQTADTFYPGITQLTKAPSGHVDIYVVSSDGVITGTLIDNIFTGFKGANNLLSSLRDSAKPFKPWAWLNGKSLSDRFSDWYESISDVPNAWKNAARDSKASIDAKKIDELIRGGDKQLPAQTPAAPAQTPAAPAQTPAAPAPTQTQTQTPAAPAPTQTQTQTQTQADPEPTQTKTQTQTQADPAQTPVAPTTKRDKYKTGFMILWKRLGKIKNTRAYGEWYMNIKNSGNYAQAFESLVEHFKLDMRPEWASWLESIRGYTNAGAENKQVKTKSKSNEPDVQQNDDGLKINRPSTFGFNNNAFTHKQILTRTEYEKLPYADKKYYKYNIGNDTYLLKSDAEITQAAIFEPNMKDYDNPLGISSNGFFKQAQQSKADGGLVKDAYIKQGLKFAGRF